MQRMGDLTTKWNYFELAYLEKKTIRATVDGHKARDKKQVEDCDTIRKKNLPKWHNIGVGQRVKNSRGKTGADETSVLLFRDGISIIVTAAALMSVHVVEAVGNGPGLS